MTVARIPITLAPTLRRLSAHPGACATRTAPASGASSTTQVNALRMSDASARTNQPLRPTEAAPARRPQSPPRGACSARMRAASVPMNQPLRPIDVAPASRPQSAPRGAAQARAALPGRDSFRARPLDQERALSVIECELLVLTYHCDPQLQTVIKVDRAKWAPERSIPKHVQQNKIAARRAVRRRAKRARREQLDANSKSHAVGKRESHLRL